VLIGPFYSVSQLIKGIHNGRAKGIALIGINETEDK